MAVTTQMRTDVSQLYVALFGRAPDAEGLAFWAGLRDSGQTVAQLADTMFGTSPARAYFPSFLTNQEIISSFYFNVLGRQADAGGLAFWTAKLNAAGATPGSVIAEMIGVIANYTGSDPAGAASAALFNNRSAAAQFYSEHNGSLEHSTTVLAGVTSAQSTVAAAQTLVVASGAKGTIDAAGFTEVSLGAVSGDLTLAHVGAGTSLVVTHSVSDSELLPSGDIGPVWTVNWQLADATGSNDSLAITLKSADTVVAGFLTVAGIEHLTVTSVDTDANAHYNAVYLKETSLLSLTVAGNAQTEFDWDMVVDTFDATGLPGGAYVVARSGWWGPGALIGGAGSDTLYSAGTSEYTIDGGAGDDWLLSSGGNIAMTGGTGADYFRPGDNSHRDRFSTITDFTKGTASAPGDTIDLIALAGWLDPVWTASKLVVGGSPSFNACLDAATAATNITFSQHVARWFQYAGDTYIVVDNSSAATFQDGVDQFVKLTGLIELNTLTWANGELH